MPGLNPPPVSREVAYAAVFALVQNVQWNSQAADPPALVGWKESSRKVKLWTDAANPSIFQAEHGETSAMQTNMPYRRMFKCNWIVYQNQSGLPGGYGAIENNQILDAIQQALLPTPQDPGYGDERQTLNGLVWSVKIVGEIFKDPGDIDGEGMMVIPIQILAP